MQARAATTRPSQGLDEEIVANCGLWCRNFVETARFRRFCVRGGVHAADKPKSGRDVPLSPERTEVLARRRGPGMANPVGGKCRRNALTTRALASGLFTSQSARQRRAHVCALEEVLREICWIASHSIRAISGGTWRSVSEIRSQDCCRLCCRDCTLCHLAELVRRSRPFLLILSVGLYLTMMLMMPPEQEGLPGGKVAIP